MAKKAKKKLKTVPNSASQKNPKKQERAHAAVPASREQQNESDIVVVEEMNLADSDDPRDIERALGSLAAQPSLQNQRDEEAHSRRTAELMRRLFYVAGGILGFALGVMLILALTNELDERSTTLLAATIGGLLTIITTAIQGLR